MNTGARIGGTVAVALVLALFLLASGDLFYLKLVQSFQTFTGKKRALKAVYDVERRVSRYLLTITIINAGLGVSVGLYLFALGLPVPYVWGLAAFLLNFLPYIGGVIGAVLVGPMPSRPSTVSAMPSSPRLAIRSSPGSRGSSSPPTSWGGGWS